jgi:HK97 family phage major capsid protein
MNRLDALKARLRSIVESMDKMLAVMIDDKGDQREPTAAESAEFDRLNASVKTLTDSIAREQAVIDAGVTAKRVMPADGTVTPPHGVVPVDATTIKAAPQDVKGTITGIVPNFALTTRVKDLTISEKISIFMHAMYMGKALNTSTDKVLDDLGFAQFGDATRAARAKALSSNTLTAGSELIPQMFAAEFIPFLYNRSWFLKSNPNRIDLTQGNLTVPGGGIGASASWRTEGSDVAYTQATFIQKTLGLKNLAAVTAINRELLSRSPIAVASIVQTDLSTAYAMAIDIAALRGDGTGNTPVGIRNLVNAANIFVAPAGVSPAVATIDALAALMIGALENSNIPIIAPAWVMNNVTCLFLATLRGANGEKIYPGMESENPTFWGYPVHKTNQVPKNLGAGTDESEIYLTDMGHFWFGDGEAITMEMSTEASYVQAGVLQSAFSKNQVAIKISGSHGMMVRFDKAFAVATNVRWGR